MNFFRLGLLAIIFAGCGQKNYDDQFKNPDGKNWTEYQGDGARSHFSQLDQINAANLSKLKVAWEYASDNSDTALRGTQIQCNPVIVNGILYGVSAKLQAFAIDAATGKQIWKTDFKGNSGTLSRGVTYFNDGEKEMLFWGAGHWLYCLDAKSGAMVKSFGDSGRIDLVQGIQRPGADDYITSNTPNTIYKDLLITGMRISEEERALLGDIRAYNVYTGQLVWTFHTIPQAGEPGFDTWKMPEPRKNIGGANSWAGMAIDRERGIVYAPTGSASYDFYGGNRKGNNLYASSLLALDAATGKLKWHFQFVHHDLWDRDPPATPNLLTVMHNGKKTDAVAQITKQGWVFVFDRENGKPLFEIKETPVSTDGIAGEEYSPTQPIPVLPEPFARQRFSKNDINPAASNYAELVSTLDSARPGIPYVPVTAKMTIFFPGTDGGAQWGGAATDEEGIMYIPSKEVPCYTTLVPTPVGKELSGSSLYASNCSSCHGPDKKGTADGTFPSLLELGKKYNETQVSDILKNGRGRMPSFGILPLKERELLIKYILTNTDEHTLATEIKTTLPYRHTGYNRWFDSDGYPVSRPPWGTLTALDLNTGKRGWQVALGEYPELSAKGIPATGTDNYGGPLVTKSGLIFIAATRDEKFRVFEKATGKLLWTASLPAAGFATPSTYMVNGKQYVVIACGGGKLKQKSGDKYVAFALEN